jgi:hypothetical protein
MAKRRAVVLWFVDILCGMPPEIRSTSYERFPEHMIGVLCV